MRRDSGNAERTTISYILGGKKKQQKQKQNDNWPHTMFTILF